jgi:hypothetical protein
MPFNCASLNQHILRRFEDQQRKNSPQTHTGPTEEFASGLYSQAALHTILLVQHGGFLAEFCF